MIKKILLSLAMFGFVFGSPILANAASFTNLKAQLFDLSTKIENFKKVESNGEVLGATSTLSIDFDPGLSFIGYGYTTRFTWSTSGAETCVASNDFSDESWVGNMPTNGSYLIQLKLTAPGYAYLECEGNGIKEKSSVYLQPYNNPPVVDFIAEPNIVKYGESSTLTWSSKTPNLIYSCEAFSVSGTGGSWFIPHYKSFPGSQVMDNIKTNVSYELNCSTVAGAKKFSTDVQLDYLVPKVDLIATPSNVFYLGSTKLSWTAKNVKNVPFPCKASKDWSGNKSLTGEEIISGIKSDKTFTLECVDKIGIKILSTVKVKVIKPDDKTDYPGPKDDPNKDDDTQRVGTNTGTSGTCAFTFKKDLAYGSTDSVKNKDVSLMQSVLVDEEFLSNRDASGKFYSITQSALKKFQKKYNLSQTGKVDQKTRIKLNELFPVYCNQ